MKTYKKHSKEAIEKKRLTTSNLWQNADYKKKQTESQKKNWKENPSRLFRLKERLKKYWSEISDENKEKRNQKIKEKRALQDMSFLLGDNNPSKRLEVIAKIKLARQKRKERLGCINLPETREKIKQAAIEQFKDPKQREASRERMIKTLLSPKNSYFKDTSIEIKMQNELKKRNISFEKHKPLLKRYVVDLFIKPNIVIECDGCFYHSCKHCGFTKYHQEVSMCDDKKTSDLVQHGFSVYRFWEHEINNSLELCLNKVNI